MSRWGEGRKPIIDCTKKQEVKVFVEGCLIEQWGSKDKLRNYILDFVLKGPDKLPESEPFKIEILKSKFDKK
jgi:hypothetical protein